MGNVCTGPKSTIKAVVGGGKDKPSGNSTTGGANAIRRSHQSGIRDDGQFVNGSNTTINSKSAVQQPTDEATIAIGLTPPEGKNSSSATSGGALMQSAGNDVSIPISERSPAAQNQDSSSSRSLPSPTERQQSSTSATSGQTAITTSLSAATSQTTMQNQKSKISPDGVESLIAATATTESNASDPPKDPIVEKDDDIQSPTSSIAQNGSTSFCNGHSSNGGGDVPSYISMAALSRVTPSVVDEYWEEPKIKQFTLMYLAQQTADAQLAKLSEAVSFISDDVDPSDKNDTEKDVDESSDSNVSDTEISVPDRHEPGLMTLDIFQKALLSVSSDISLALSADFSTWSSNIFNKLDCNNEGLVHYIEFMAIFLHEKVTRRSVTNGTRTVNERHKLDEDELKEVFNIFDKDQAGTLSKGNLRQTLAIDWDLEFVDVLDIYTLVDEMFNQMPLEHEECITFSDFSLLFQEHE